MTQNISKMKINEVAKAVLQSSVESIDAIKSMQSDMTAQMESIRRLESELVRRAREEAEKANTVKRDTEETAVEPATEELSAQSTQSPQAEQQLFESDAQPEPLSEQTGDHSAQTEITEEPKTETKVDASGANTRVKQGATTTVRFERPAERLARKKGTALRDDAAIRNAQRPNRPAPSNRPQRPSQTASPGERSQRPSATRTGDSRPGSYTTQRNAARPTQPGARKSNTSTAPLAADIPRKAKASNYDPKKSSYVRVFDSEKKSKSRKALERERAALLKAQDYDGSAYGRRRKKRKPSSMISKPEPIRIEKAVITGETVTIKTLADRIGKPASDIIKKLMMLGIIVTINHEIEYETAALVASDFGIELDLKIEKTAEDSLVEVDADEQDEDMIKRPPVVTIMGHVDHGKTSLLDKIRSTRVTEAEAGGITQHIGAYRVFYNDQSITFLDTPGHEAFTAMRARGAQVTDAVVLVVAADDGVMPQTVEAINHAKAANVPIIVAINKMDLPNSNPERVTQELTEHGLVWDEWGGDTVIIKVSAKTGDGIDELLEMIILVSDVLELKASPDRAAKGAIVEAKLDKGRGPVATVLVQNGTLKVGQTVVAGTSSGRIRAMLDDAGRKVEEAGPSMPVEVLGFDYVPSAGDILYEVEDTGLTRQIIEERKNKIKSEQMKMTARVTLDDLYEQIKEGQVKDLNVIVKADVQGSVEAVRSSLEKLSNEHVRVHCIHGGAGSIIVTDVMLASASNAIIIGFNVRPDGPARIAADREGVDIRLYRVIYNAIEDIEKAMKGMLEPVFEEVILGRAEVRELYKVSAIGTIAGCMVQDGKIMRNADIRLLRDNVVVFEGRLASLKRFKDDAREVVSGYECGLSLQNFNDIKKGDVIEAFTQEEVKQV